MKKLLIVLLVLFFCCGCEQEINYFVTEVKPGQIWVSSCLQVSTKYEVLAVENGYVKYRNLKNDRIDSGKVECFKVNAYLLEGGRP